MPKPFIIRMKEAVKKAADAEIRKQTDTVMGQICYMAYAEQGIDEKEREEFDRFFKDKQAELMNKFKGPVYAKYGVEE